MFIIHEQFKRKYQINYFSKQSREKLLICDSAEQTVYHSNVAYVFLTLHSATQTTSI